MTAALVTAAAARLVVEEAMRSFMRKLADEIDARANDKGPAGAEALREVATELRATAEDAPELPPARYVAIRQHTTGHAAFVFEWNSDVGGYVETDAGLVCAISPTAPDLLAEAEAMAERLGCEVQS